MHWRGATNGRDPLGLFNLPGVVYGVYSGFVGAYISSSGNFTQGVIGGVVGGVVGNFLPQKAGYIATGVTNFAASVAGQVANNVTSGKPPTSIDWFAKFGAGVGGAAGNWAGHYLTDPRRTAFTYNVSQRLTRKGENVARANVEGVVGGVFEWIYSECTWAR